MTVRVTVQEDEKIGVNQHVHEAVRKSDVYAQNVVKGPPVPRIEFDDVWRTTNGFNAEYAAPPALPASHTAPTRTSAGACGLCSESLCTCRAAPFGQPAHKCLGV